MGKNSIAKITRPKASHVLLRERLFRLLDDTGNRPVAWITGPAGVGKTTLVCSWIEARKLPCLWYQVDEGEGDPSTFFYYMGLAAQGVEEGGNPPLPLLTPEYLLDVPTFTRRYFEALCLRLKSPAVIVFDNYQDAPPASGFHEMIGHGLDVLPEGIEVVVISRAEPPPALARLRANGGGMALLGGEELSFTLDESGEFIKTRHGDLSAEAICQLHARTGGWAAGLLLLTESAKIRKLDQGAVAALDPQGIFDYFSTVIFDRADAETRDFLLKTALPRTITAAIAQKISGQAHAQTLLSRLNRGNYFTDCGPPPNPSYRYHPLFREFLLARAASVFAPAELSRIRRRAAEILWEAGQIEDAATLLSDAEEWDGLLGLATANARPLLAQGRSISLLGWLAVVPHEFVDQDPWALYWLGVCHLHSAPSVAREHLRQAHHLFVVRHEPEGQLLACAGIVDALTGEWNDFTPMDGWLERLLGYLGPQMPALALQSEIKARSSLAIALMVRRPHHPGLAQLFARALSIARQGSDLDLHLHVCTWAANYYFWLGEHSKSGMLLAEVRKLAQRPDASPITRITWMWMEAAKLIVVNASPAEALAMVAEAHSFAHTTGIHVWDHMIVALGVYGSLLLGDAEAATAYLKMSEGCLQSSRRHGYCHYYGLKALLGLQKADFDQVAADARLACEIGEETGFVFPIMLCRLYLAHGLHGQGRPQEAEARLREAARLCAGSGSVMIHYMCLLTEAGFALDLGREEEGVTLLAKALRVGRENGYTFLLWFCHPAFMGRLCAKALECGVEVAYTRGLILKCGLVPASPDVVHAGWPYPVRITTLGRFKLLRDGQIGSFTGKMQKKPLELLKILIALGGREVGVGRISELLWPDADGDLAHKSFETTLYRLRLLLGVDKGLRLRNGLLSLDGRYCRLDVWEFEALADRAEVEATPTLIERAITLYRGNFLPADLGESWSIAPRERLKRKYHRLLLATGSRLEEQGQWATAVEFYHQGLETDERVEEFHQHLMHCHIEMGHHAQAMAAYERCRTILRDTLGIRPSPRTEAMLARIRALPHPASG